MALCTITYSPSVAERAARRFFWRKWRTPFGIVFLSAFVICSVGLIAWIRWIGLDWFAGMLGTLLAMNLMIQWARYSQIPKALARFATERKTAELETTD